MCSHRRRSRFETRRETCAKRQGAVQRRRHTPDLSLTVVAQKKTVLVVDDEPTIADVVARYLERDGYRALTAAGGQDAIEIADRERPDLVILDVMMPGLDGLGVMAVLR